MLGSFNLVPGHVNGYVILRVCWEIKSPMIKVNAVTKIIVKYAEEWSMRSEVEMMSKTFAIGNARGLSIISKLLRNNSNGVKATGDSMLNIIK